MKTFSLHIGTPDGLLFEGNVEKVICRTITGDLAILSGHSNFCTALGMGESTVVMEDGSRRVAACIGGMLSVMNGTCIAVPIRNYSGTIIATLSFSGFIGVEDTSTLLPYLEPLREASERITSRLYATWKH